MTDHGEGAAAKQNPTVEEIRQSWEHAARVAIEQHRQAGEPVVTWDWVNNKVLLRSADEILAEAEQHDVSVDHALNQAR